MSRTGVFNKNWTPLENEIADEWVRRDALKTCQGRACAEGCTDSCSRKCCRRQFVVACNCFMVLMAIMSIGILIMLFALMIVPYFKSKSDKPTTCTTYQTDFDIDNMVSCNCGRYCSSYYPCLKIHVRYTRDDGKEVETMLHAYETGGSCTYSSCSRSVEMNVESIENYKDKYGGIGDSFPCLYNPAEGSKEVIRERLNSDTTVTHMIVWPLVIALLFSLIVVFVFRTCGCRYTCQTDPPQDVKVTAARLRQLGVYTLKQLPPEERQRVLRECAPGPEDIESPAVV